MYQTWQPLNKKIETLCSRYEKVFNETYFRTYFSPSIALRVSNALMKENMPMWCGLWPYIQYIKDVAWKMYKIFIERKYHPSRIDFLAFVSEDMAMI